MIAEKLVQIEHFLAARGIALDVTRQPPVDEQTIAVAEKAMGHSLPQALRDIYIHYANGFMVFWQDVRAERDWDFARFCVPDLDCFVRETVRFRKQHLADYQHPERNFDRPEEARPVLERMLNWGVLWDTGGDGDIVCIDLESGAVIFHEREWWFYDSYINGYLIATDLDRLIDDWGNVCFLHFSGCPGHCPPYGGSAIPDYDSQPYDIRT